MRLKTKQVSIIFILKDMSTTNAHLSMVFTDVKRALVRLVACPSPSGCTPGIDKSLALERKIESRKRNFSLDLENLIVPISLSTLDFREWQETILFLLSIFESGKTNFSFYSRFLRV